MMDVLTKIMKEYQKLDLLDQSFFHPFADEKIIIPGLGSEIFIGTFSSSFYEERDIIGGISYFFFL